MKSDPSKNNANDFASLYEQSFSGMTNFKPGQLVETQILSISKDTIFLQLNGKCEGILPRDEVADSNGNLTVQVGDTLKVYFLRADQGEMQFTTRLSGESAGPDLLEKAFHDQIPVEGVVEKEIKGGYEVKIGDVRAFCPYSQMGAKRSENSAQYVGKKLLFRIQEYKENGRNILVSNRIFHEEAHQENLENLKKTLKEGLIVTGSVQSLQDFGAFVDVAGVKALLPISEIARSRVEDISKVLTVGQEIRAQIIKIDWASEKITLSKKILEADPWEKAVEKFAEGSRHEGKVARIATFGVFVTLEAGLDGLIHISEFKNDGKFGGNGEINLKVGQSVVVRIQSIDRANKRISLKPTTTKEEDETTAKYLDGGASTDTYNPFASLLKKK